MLRSVILCLYCDLLNAILSPSKFVNFDENLLCCSGLLHDVTCSRRKVLCNVFS